MNLGTADLIKEHLSFKCSICLQDYNSTDHYPYEICSNSHSVCGYCLSNHLLKSRNPKCPQCRQTIKNSLLKKFPKRLTNQIISVIQEVKKKDYEIFGLMYQKIQDKLTLLDENSLLRKNLIATFDQLQAEKRNVSYFCQQNISLKNQLQQKKQQNTRILIILIYVIVAIFYLIFFGQTQAYHSQPISLNRLTDLDDKISQLFKDQQQKIIFLTQEISTIQKKKQQHFQKIRTFLETKGQHPITQLLTRKKSIKSLKDFYKLSESIYQYKKQQIKSYQDKKSLFNAQVQLNQQLLIAIKQAWSQITTKSKENNQMDNFL